MVRSIKNVANGKVIKFMSKLTKSRRSRSSLRATISVCTLATVAGVGFGWVHWHNNESLHERYITRGVQRADLFPTRLASGRVESGKRTIIECQLENIAVGVRGQRLTAAGASVLLSVIPEGSVVKRGDVLAVLDSSDYEELLRLQRITLERAKADKLQADLDVEIARLAVREYQEGTVPETNQDFEGKIFLARSELERAIDRLNWSRRMNQKGYTPAAVVTSDQFREDQMALALTATRICLRVVQKIHGSQDLSQSSKAQRKGPGQRSNIKSFVSRATLTGWPRSKSKWKTAPSAPHTTALSSTPTMPTASFSSSPVLPVRERQPLFFLPDLDDMEVVAMLHESIVDQVDPGMRATVHVEGLSDRRIEGHVTKIATMADIELAHGRQVFRGDCQAGERAQRAQAGHERRGQNRLASGRKRTGGPVRSSPVRKRP